MVRNARFSWNDEDHFEFPDRTTGLDDLDDFDFDGFETARRKRAESKRESGKQKAEGGEPESNALQRPVTHDHAP